MTVSATSIISSPWSDCLSAPAQAALYRFLDSFISQEIRGRVYEPSFNGTMALIRENVLRPAFTNHGRTFSTIAHTEETSTPAPSSDDTLEKTIRATLSENGEIQPSFFKFSGLYEILGHENFNAEVATMLEKGRGESFEVAKKGREDWRQENPKRRSEPFWQGPTTEHIIPLIEQHFGFKDDLTTQKLTEQNRKQVLEILAYSYKQGWLKNPESPNLSKLQGHELTELWNSLKGSNRLILSCAILNSHKSQLPLPEKELTELKDIIIKACRDWVAEPLQSFDMSPILTYSKIEELIGKELLDSIGTTAMERNIVAVQKVLGLDKFSLVKNSIPIDVFSSGFTKLHHRIREEFGSWLNTILTQALTPILEKQVETPGAEGTRLLHRNLLEARTRLLQALPQTVRSEAQIGLRCPNE